MFILIILHSLHSLSLFFFFFFNDTATTEIYTLSLHDALPIFFAAGRLGAASAFGVASLAASAFGAASLAASAFGAARSEEHTSELQSQSNLVCRLLLEKKKKVEMSTLFKSSTHHIRSTGC